MMTHGGASPCLSAKARGVFQGLRAFLDSLLTVKLCVPLSLLDVKFVF